MLLAGRAEGHRVPSSTGFLDTARPDNSVREHRDVCNMKWNMYVIKMFVCLCSRLSICLSLCVIQLPDAVPDIGLPLMNQTVQNTRPALKQLYLLKPTEQEIKHNTVSD